MKRFSGLKRHLRALTLQRYWEGTGKPASRTSSKEGLSWASLLVSCLEQPSSSWSDSWSDVWPS